MESIDMSLPSHSGLYRSEYYSVVAHQFGIGISGIQSQFVHIDQP